MKSPRHLVAEEKGGALVEFALTLPLFLVLLFATIDFSQIYLRWILAEKATHIAARMAAVRPPVCAGVPERNERRIPALGIIFGTTCSLFGSICANPGAVTCTGAQAVGDQLDTIMAAIEPLLPPGARPQDLVFTYEFSGLGFLGGPFLPLVTVEFGPDVAIPYITPLGPLLAAFQEGGAGSLASLSLPPMRATLPGEDLALGGAG